MKVRSNSIYCFPKNRLEKEFSSIAFYASLYCACTIFISDSIVYYASSSLAWVNDENNAVNSWNLERDKAKELFMQWLKEELMNYEE